MNEDEGVGVHEAAAVIEVWGGDGGGGVLKRVARSGTSQACARRRVWVWMQVWVWVWVWVWMWVWVWVWMYVWGGKGVGVSFKRVMQEVAPNRCL